MAIVMGLDQRPAQIAADWIDTDTGELARATVPQAFARSAAGGGAGGDHGPAVRRRGTACGRRGGSSRRAVPTANALSTHCSAWH